MVLRLKILLGALGLMVIASPLAAQSPKAVVELFTSQGCSSCPPADAILSDLARRPDVIALTLPVDYWDYLGWKDTFGQRAFSWRQRSYAHLRGDHQVYTPQAVVNGTKPCLGSDRAQVDRSIADPEGKSLPVNVTLSEKDGQVMVAVDGAPGHSADLWVLPVLKTRTVDIGRGENQGRRAAYTNVVRGFIRIGEWHGGPAHFQVPVSVAREEADGYVVLLQVPQGTKPGPILGAAKSAGL
jgi:hypothetical protein